ncbi:hypothetical protein P168DRAFT_302439 [Aspergillus campestris IBT 28561]|uniref:Uncharacterized protein n=1 Tax=Aspergillus campestris (strain IBT 28561) TaxID=1392248 RepID=A0A2I1DCB1_ASPC2|nr:uncharacterized protein P168DRAFT_302439 [Aspergillus campestris IBT 28561]PKY07523.1 hypothetical protein P168DRAFT_302439 [Aspergillus campestris IBT 28561]
MPPTTFPQFPLLPPELRRHIRFLALGKLRPALYPFRTGCWCPRQLREGDANYDANTSYNIDIDLRHELLDHVPLPPRAPRAVNREGRGITRDWLRAELQILQTKQSQLPPWTFSSTGNVMYVASNQEYDFLVGPLDRLDEADVEGQIVCFQYRLGALAVSEVMVREAPEDLVDILDWMNLVEVLYVVVGEQPDLTTVGVRVRWRWRWEVDGEGRRGYVWNSDDGGGGFRWGDGERIGGEELSGKIEEFGGEIAKWCRSNRVKRFQIKPVYAVRSIELYLDMLMQL